MPHRDEPLDEGVLHAFLDGALPAAEAAAIEARARASAETREQIELARQLRAEADALVDLVQFEPAPLGAVAREPRVAAAAMAAPRQGGSAAPGGPARTPWYRRRLDRSAMGWAAGLLLLVGAVWLGTPTGSVNTPGAELAAAPEPAAEAEAAPPPAPASAPAPAPAAPEAKARTAAPAAKPSSPASATGAVDLARREPAPAIAAAAAPAAPPPAADAPAPSIAAAGATANALREADERKLEAPSLPVARARPGRATPPASAEEVGGAPAALAKRSSDAARVLQVAGLGTGRIEQLPDGGVRTVYEGANGAPAIVLEQWQIAAQPADLRADASAMAQSADRATAPSIRWVQHGVQLRLSGKVSVDSLERLRRRVE